MILIFGGTTEGRICAGVCEEAHQPFYYSTKFSRQDIDLVFGEKVTGGLDEAQMVDFCKLHDIKLIIDAAHPFAENLHQNIFLVSQTLNIPVLRYEREYPQRDSSLIWVDNFEGAVSFLEDYNVDKLLALSGVNTIAKLKSYWENHTSWFRILDRSESFAVADASGYPRENLVFYHKDSDNLEELLQTLKPRALLTKESGESGGFTAKMELSKRYRIPLIVVKRPILSDTFKNIYGPYGLRKEIERYVPEFFPLKIGFTTGTCATAATKAAFIALLSGHREEKVSLTLPSGEQIFIPCRVTKIAANEAQAVVIKDAGDDPDVTHQKEIVSTVNLSVQHKGVRFLQGEGVGVVTLPGLGLEIGGPAINKTPRMMMKREIYKVMCHYEDKLPNGFTTGVDVTVSVPEGRELASKTFNPRLGITDGISIIGTSGVVKPFSSEAFIASIKREMEVARALGCTEVVINSGAKSERYLKARFPDLPNNAFVHYGNFIGEAITTALEVGFTKLDMGIMLGKAVKLAKGSLDTHSKKTVMDREFIVEMALEANCTTEIVAQIEEVNLARQLWDFIPTTHAFYQVVLKRCLNTCTPLFPNRKLSIFLLTDEGEIIAYNE